MSLPIAKPSGSVTFFHSLLVKIPCKRTSAALRFGTSIPTARWPGIGASIRRLWAARLSARFVSSAEMRDNFTPLGGLSVYWVTLGPMLAPSIFTSMLNSCSVSRIIWALCSISPASAGLCFFSSKSTLGACQLGSFAITSADLSSADLSCSTLPFSDERRVCLTSLAFSAALSVGTPAFSLKSAIGADLASLALRMTLTFASCSLVSPRTLSTNQPKTANGVRRSTNSSVMIINNP